MRKPKNIILLVADSLRKDSVYRTGMSEMPYAEQHAIQFTQARSSACWTLPATSCLFTGKMPHEHGATNQSRYLKETNITLAQRLKKAGYASAQVTANPVTTDIFGVDKGFDEVHKIWQLVEPKFKRLTRFLILAGKPRIRKMVVSKEVATDRMAEDLLVANCWMQHTFQDTFDKSREILERNTSKNKGTFLFINLMEAHFPYHIAPTFEFSSQSTMQKMREAAGLFKSLNQTFLHKDKQTIRPETLRVLRDRQMQSWKALAKGIDAFIQELHQDKDNLIVFCADHGDTFGEQDWIYHFSNVTDAGNRVPLFWLDGTRKAQVIDRPVSSRLIHNAILSACGIDLDEPVSLFDTEDISMPLMESYWYKHAKGTLDKYIYNQFAFVNEGMRYVHRAAKWHSAPITGDGDLWGKETKFEPMNSKTNPLQELIVDQKRKVYIQSKFDQYKRFSDKIMDDTLPAKKKGHINY